MQYLLILILCASAHNSLAKKIEKVDRWLVPQLSSYGEIEEEKTSLLEKGRYGKINSYLEKHATSGEFVDVFTAAKRMREELSDLGYQGRTFKEDSIYRSLNYFIRLEEIVEELEKNQCSKKAQQLFEVNDYHTKGRIYSNQLKKSDLYAGTVRKLILERAQKCQDIYAKEIDNNYVALSARLEGDKKVALIGLYLEFVSKLIAKLKEENTFVPYVVPKEIDCKNLGETVFNSLVPFEALTNDEKVTQMRELKIRSHDLIHLLQDNIILAANQMTDLGQEWFIMAAMDKRVAGDDARFSWMDSKQFVQRLEGFLFRRYFRVNLGILAFPLQEYIKEQRASRAN